MLSNFENEDFKLLFNNLKYLPLDPQTVKKIAPTKFTKFKMKLNRGKTTNKFKMELKYTKFTDKEVAQLKRAFGNHPLEEVNKLSDKCMTKHQELLKTVDRFLFSELIPNLSYEERSLEDIYHYLT